MKNQNRQFSDYYYDRMDSQERVSFEDKLKQDFTLLEAYNAYRLFTNATLENERQLMLEEVRSSSIEDDSVILHYIHDMLPADDKLIQQIEHRIQVDSAYAQRIEQYRREDAELNVIIRGAKQTSRPVSSQPTARVRQLPTRRWLSVAATILLLAVAGWWATRAPEQNSELLAAYEQSVVADKDLDGMLENKATSSLLDDVFRSSLSAGDFDLRESDEFMEASVAWESDDREGLRSAMERLRVKYPEAWQKDVDLQVAYLRFLQEEAPNNVVSRELALQLFPLYLDSYKKSHLAIDPGFAASEPIIVGYKVAMLKALDPDRRAEASTDLTRLLEENNEISPTLREQIQNALDQLQ